MYLDEAANTLHGETIADQAVGLSVWIIEAFADLHRVLSNASDGER